MNMLDKDNMMNRSPDYKLDYETLQTFLICVEQGSLSAAAKMLFITPSAVSYRLRTLEEKLGLQLITRTTHSIAPTEAGKRLIDRAKHILEWQNKIQKELKLIHTGIEPCFNLVINNLLYRSDAAAALVAHLTERFPSTSFRIERGVYMGVWDSLISGHAHAAIGTPTLHTIDEAFSSIPLGTIHWELVCAPSHPIRHTESITEDVLGTIPVVNIEDSSVLINKRAPWRLLEQEEIFVPDLTTKIECHKRGLGIGFLPRPLAHAYTQAHELIVLNNTTVHRDPSPMSFTRPTRSDGVIGAYLEELVITSHDLINPFLSFIDDKTGVE